jgi:hypothetical protein
MNNKYKKYLELKEKLKKYADGGEVQDDKSYLQDLSDKLKKAFKTPEIKLPQPPPEEDKYDKIRRENHERMMGQREDFKGYAEGGIVNTFAGLAPLYKQIYGTTRNPVEKKFPLNIPKGHPIKTPKRLSPINIVKGYADGGDIDDPFTLTPEEYNNFLESAKSQGMGVEKVEGPEQNVSASKLESQYIPEEEDANKAAGLTADAGIGLVDQIDKALAEDKKQPDQRSLEGITLSKDEALKDAEPGKMPLPEEQKVAEKARPDSDKAIEDAVKADMGGDRKPAGDAVKPEDGEKPYNPISALDDATKNRNSISNVESIGCYCRTWCRWLCRNKTHSTRNL